MENHERSIEGRQAERKAARRSQADWSDERPQIRAPSDHGAFWFAVARHSNPRLWRGLRSAHPCGLRSQRSLRELL